MSRGSSCSRGRAAATSRSCSRRSAGPRSAYRRCRRMAPMDFLIEHDPLDHAHLVTASGELDVAAAPQLSAILTMGAASSQPVVVLDMGGATFIDSTAL